MKKTLLLGTFAIFGLMANAQLVTEVTAESLEAAGLVKDKAPVEGGTVIGEGEAGTIALAFDDSWGTTAPSGNYSTVYVNDVELSLKNGAVGNANPTFVNYAAGAPTAGAVFEITPSADGWLTIFTKMNPNKQYVVFEGTTSPVAYHLGYSNGTVSIEYTLPFDADYYIDFEAPDAADYFIPAGGEGPEDVKPQFPWIVSGQFLAEQEADENFKFEAQDTGFVTFYVGEGATYYFCALGSKAAAGSFVLTEGDVPPVVKFAATDSQPEVAFGPGFGMEAGVGSLIADPANENAPVYNVLGQKVGADAKGILIQNGKKFIRR
ncbi:MAG: hypothetical protein J1F38_10575 [Muribaculaceae bacterium]|nr:hypothetical protein [Muribaculaceae bacterium]